MSEVTWKIGPIITGAIFQQSSCDKDSRILLVSELDIGKSLVVAQQDIEARLVLLDQVVF